MLNVDLLGKRERAYMDVVEEDTKRALVTVENAGRQIITVVTP